MKKIILLSIVSTNLLLTQCNQKISSTSSTAAFYDMGLVYQRSDPGGKDYFQVFGKGSNLEGCKNNAKLQVMKALIFDGFSRGINYTPILNDPKQISIFKEQENSFYKKWANNNTLINVQNADEQNALSQSADEPSQYSIKLLIGVDRAMLKKEVLNLISTK